MRRTHILHTRDNRRGFSYYNEGVQVDTRARPVIVWENRSSGRPLFPTKVMTLDGKEVARVEPVGPADHVWNHPDGIRQRHDAFILAGPRAGERKAFPDDCDSARLFCERAFAEAST